MAKLAARRPFDAHELRRPDHVLEGRLGRPGGPVRTSCGSLFHPDGEFTSPTRRGRTSPSVRLPLAPPTFYEFEVHRRPALAAGLWVDLFQRATGKLRWRPFRRASVEVTCFDSYRWGPSRIGHKGLIDALKVATTGRRDRRLLYYFGAIEDDGPGFLVPPFGVSERLIDDPAQAHCVVRVTPA